MPTQAPATGNESRRESALDTDQSSASHGVRNTPTSWMHANDITSDQDVGPQLDTAPLISDSISKIRPVAYQFPLRAV